MQEISRDTEKEAKIWASSQRKSGKSDSDIRTEMLNKGYSPALINKLLRKKGRLLIYIFIAAILAAGIYFLIPVISTISFSKSCDSQECFLTAANNCENAKFQQTEAGSLFEYSANKCVLTKTLKKINETEPVEMKDLLEGKSLTCSYTFGGFNENWIKTLSIDIDACSGELKDSIEELMLAV